MRLFAYDLGDNPRLVTDANGPIGIDVAKDGKVYWTEMGPAGNAAGQYNAQGAIMMHDQKGAPGNKTTVATILTRADHGNSEDGVLGFSLQPGFDLSDPDKRHVFAYYSPRPGPGDDWPLTSSPARQVVGYNQISRWTLNAEGTAARSAARTADQRQPRPAAVTRDSHRDQSRPRITDYGQAKRAEQLARPHGELQGHLGDESPSPLPPPRAAPPPGRSPRGLIVGHISPRWILAIWRWALRFPLWKRGSGGFAGRHRFED